MTRTIRTIVVAAAFAAVAGCGSSLIGPTPASSSTELAIFLDRETGFTTSDVRDAQDQIIRFNAAGELIWTADNTRYPGYIADGAVITADRQCVGCYFLVRFGTVSGEPRAYLTWVDTVNPDKAPTIVDVEVKGLRLVVTDTSKAIPRT